MIYAHKIQDENGEFVDADQQRWTVVTSSLILGNMRTYWQQFLDLAAALDEWGLTPVESEEEEKLNLE